MLIEMSKECHSHKPQPTTDTQKKKKKINNRNICMQDKQSHAREAYRLASPSRAEHNAKHD